MLRFRRRWSCFKDSRKILKPSKLIQVKNKNKSQTFRIRETSMDEIKTSIQNLDPKKASQKNMNTSKEKCGFFLHFNLFFKGSQWIKRSRCCTYA